MPNTSEDLDQHRLIVYGNDSRPPVPDVNWLLRAGRKGRSVRQADLTVNNTYAVMRAVRNGAGVGALPAFMAQDGEGLVHILPELTGPQIDAYFVYPEELRASKRITVFRDFLLRQVAQSNF